MPRKNKQHIRSTLKKIKAHGDGSTVRGTFKLVGESFKHIYKKVRAKKGPY